MHKRLHTWHNNVDAIVRGHMNMGGGAAAQGGNTVATLLLEEDVCNPRRQHSSNPDECQNPSGSRTIG